MVGNILRPFRTAFSTRAGPRPTIFSMLKIHDSSSHAEIKRAYLSLAMRIHPDKQPDSATLAHEQFAALQAAWDRYMSEPRNLKRRRTVGDDEDPLRQMFGVGCSWTDTDEERNERLSVQEQASLGITHRSALGGREE